MAIDLQFLLTPEERDFYEYHIDSLINNTPSFAWMAFLGYVICTLLFFEILSLKEHLFFGVVTLFVSVALHIHSVLLISGQLKRSSPSQTVLKVFVVGWLFLFGWCVYFYILIQKGNAGAAQGFILIQSMSSILALAMVGRFQKIAITNIVVMLLIMTSITWVKAPSMFAYLMLPAYILSLSQLLFLWTLSRQLNHVYQVKNLNNELVDALKYKNFALEQANLAQSRYLSAASHDLRQPLHALALLTSDAQRKNHQPEVSETLGKIEYAIDSLSTSFNAMLNLSRLDAGVVKPDLQLIPLQRIFDRIQVEFEETARQKGLCLIVVPTKAWVRTDEGMLHSILSNFVSNAVRYTEQGRVLLGVRRRANNQIRILVFDTGLGVPSEKAKQIFQEYQRLEYAEQRVQGGVGLGLAISERMAKLLETQLFVQSVPGRGSCFGVVTHSVAQPLAQEFKHKDREHMGDYLSGKRIAILDDDETAVDYLGELLSSWNLNVSVVLSSDMFRELVQEEGAFDLILSDYHLGLEGENGLDVLLQARTTQKEPLICVLITGDTSSELAQEVRAQQVNIVYKPLSPVRLRAYLNTLLMPK